MMNREKWHHEDSLASTTVGRGLTVDGICRDRRGVRVAGPRLGGTELRTVGLNGRQSRQVALQAELERLNKKME